MHTHSLQVFESKTAWNELYREEQQHKNRKLDPIRYKPGK